MSVENSIDVLCREFEIENLTHEQVKNENCESNANNPMSFLEEENLIQPTQEVKSEQPEEAEPNKEPTISELKDRVKNDHKEIVKLEAEVKYKALTQRYDLEDRAYMKAQLMSLISDNRAVMDTIESQLKIGTNPHLFDVYTSLSKTVADNIMKLAKIDQMVTDFKVIEDKGTGNIKHDLQKEQAPGTQSGGNTYIQNNLCFASDEILKIVKKVVPQPEKVKMEDLPKFDLT